MKLKNIINLAKMKTAKNKQIAVNWFEAFNTKNLQNLLSLYDNNAIHYSPKLKLAKPETKGFIQGKNELKAWSGQAFEKLPDLRYEPVKIIADEHGVLWNIFAK